MNKINKTQISHPLDENARKGLALFESPDVARKATLSFERRLSAKYPDSKGRRKIRFYLAFAASALLLIGVVSFLFTNNSSPEGQWVLANDWAVNPQTPLAVAALAPNRSHSETAEEQLTTGREAYTAGEFEEAASALSSYLKNTTTPRLEAYLFLGHAQLQYEPEQAIATLIAFEEHSDLDEYYRDLAQWYRSWAYVRLGQRAKAQAILSEITAKASPIQADAEQLLELLADPGAELVE